MHDIHLDDEQRDVLTEALETYLSDLRYEIGNTDAKDFRDELKHKKRLLEKTLEALKQTRNEMVS